MLLAVPTVLLWNTNLIPPSLFSLRTPSLDTHDTLQTSQPLELPLGMGPAISTYNSIFTPCANPIVVYIVLRGYGGEIKNVVILLLRT